MRSREAWLAAIAAVLGASELACKKDAADGPAAVREVPSVSSAAPITLASAPSDTTSADAIASVVPSASASTKPPATIDIGLGNIGNVGTIGTGTIGHAVCGLGHVNPSCGATASPHVQETNVNVQLLGSDSADDRRVVQTTLRARVRSCALNAAKNDPGTQGVAQLHITLDAHGAVTNVDAQGSLAEQLIACMKSSTRALKFADGAPRSLHVQVHVDRSAY